MSDKRRYRFQEYEGAIPDGPKYAQHPDDYFPVAYRVSVTGIYITNSSFDPDEAQGDLLDIVESMVRQTGTADIRVYRLTDADEVTEEQKAEWQAERVRKAQEAIDYDAEMRRRREMLTEPKPDTFSEMTDLVTGIYKAQGVLPSEEG